MMLTPHIPPSRKTIVVGVVIALIIVALAYASGYDLLRNLGKIL